jgi:Predicted outer membrane protein
MKTTHKQPRRWLSLLLAMVTILSLFPTLPAHAATAPSSATMTATNYAGTYASPNGLGSGVWIRDFTVDINGSTMAAFCHDHNKHMSSEYIGSTWSYSQTLSASQLTVTPFLAQYAYHTNFSMGIDREYAHLTEAEREAQFESQGYWSAWTRKTANAWVQGALWLANSGAISDLSDASLQKLAKERDAGLKGMGFAAGATESESMALFKEIIAIYQAGGYSSYEFYVFTPNAGSSLQPLLVPYNGGSGENTPPVYIQLQKTDGSGNYLENCVFSVYTKYDGGILSDSRGIITTGKSQWSVSDEIFLKSAGIHTLYVTETYAAPSFSINPTVYEIVVNTDTNATPATAAKVNDGNPIQNTSGGDEGQFQIVKLAAGTTKGLPGAVFDLYFEGTKIASEVTNASGIINVENAKAGTWTIVETTPPAGHSLSEHFSQTIQISQADIESGRTIRVTFENEPCGSLKVQKTSNPSNRPVAGAVFLARHLESGYQFTMTTGADGIATQERVRPGSYEIMEISVDAEKYVLDATPKTVVVKSNETASAAFVNLERGSLVIEKVSKSDGRSISGVSFLVKEADGKTVTTVTTGADGKASVSGLMPGVVYSVQEQSVPEPWILDTTPQLVTMEAGKTTTLKFENERKPTLTIVKTDAQSGKALAGAQFKVTVADGQALPGSPYTTGADGKVVIPFVDPAKLSITEIKAPDGYLIDDAAARIVTVEAGKDITVSFTDTKKPSLTLRKVDSITGDPIKGVQFELWQAVNGNLSGELKSLGTYYTNEQGEIVLSNLEVGWVRAVELQPAAGYAMPQDNEQAVFLEAGKDKILTFENTPLSALIVRKVDSVSGKVIPETLIRIRYLSGTSGTGGTVVFEGYTSVNGTVVYTGARAGTYLVEEVTPHPDYEMIGETTKTVYLSGNEQSIVTVELTNQPKGQLIIQKLSSVGNTPLAGAKFKLTDSSSAVIGANNGIYTTDAAGFIYVNEPLAVGSTIIAQEIEAPSGYLLDNTPQQILIQAGKTHMLTFYNVPEGGLQILKLDEQTRRPIAGVAFAVARMNGERIGTFTTDKNGQIFIPNLSGWFAVTEVKAAKGYLLDSTPHNIEVTDGKTAVLTITNKMASGILLHKIDSITKQGIYNVSFLLSDANNNPVGQYTTDQSGFIWIGGELPEGRYRLRELSPAAGYVADDVVRTVYLEYGRTTEIVWENTPERGQILVTKKSAAYNEVTHLPASSPLAGAVFEVYTLSGNLVDRMTTDSRGIAASKLLPPAVYLLKEVTAPPYYAINSREFIAEIRHNGDIARFEVLNENVSLGVTIQKKSQNQAVPGQMVYYDLFGIKNTSTVPLQSFFVHDRLPTDALRGVTVTTGTWSHRLTYQVSYKTNYSSSYKTLATGLSTQTNYTLSIHPNVLGLASGEYVTDIRWEFGTVPSGFASVENPKIQVQILPTLPKDYKIVNRADVGGLYLNEWQTAQTSWTMITYSGYNPPELPKTGH